MIVPTRTPPISCYYYYFDGSKENVSFKGNQTKKKIKMKKNVMLKKEVWRTI